MAYLLVEFSFKPFMVTSKCKNWLLEWCLGVPLAPMIGLKKSLPTEIGKGRKWFSWATQIVFRKEN